jgi:hypothetical protein
VLLYVSALLFVVEIPRRDLWRELMHVGGRWGFGGEDGFVAEGVASLEAAESAVSIEETGPTP